jgi:hypothetical protein
MRRRSSQMTLTPNVDQLLSERISLWKSPLIV